MTRVYCFFVVILFCVACQQQERCSRISNIPFAIVNNSGKQLIVNAGLAVAIGRPYRDEQLANEWTTDILETDAGSTHPAFDKSLIRDKSRKLSYADLAFSIYSIKASVYIRENGELKLTDATAYIQATDGSENFRYDLDPTINTLDFEGDPDKVYALLVWKHGYKLFRFEFVYNRLLKERGDKPIEIVLEEDTSEPGAGMMLQPSAEYFSMGVEVSQQGMIVVDWGNDEIESLMFNVDEDNPTATGYFYRDHHYSENDRRPVKMTGDIHLITGLFIDSSISGVDIEHCTGLEGIIFTDCHLETADLSANTNLRYFSMLNSSADNFMLPERHAIKSVHIETDGTWPNADQLDYVVQNIHANVVADS